MHRTHSVEAPVSLRASCGKSLACCDWLARKTRRTFAKVDVKAVDVYSDTRHGLLMLLWMCRH